MKKFFPLLLFTVILLQIPFDCNAWPKPDKVKKNMIGTWKFQGFYDYSGSDKPIPSNDPEILYKVYTFKEDGKCIIWSLDKSKFDFPTQTVSYAVTTREDKDGVQFAAIAFAENDVTPAEIEKKLIGTYYCVIASRTNNLCWVKTSRTQKSWKTLEYTSYIPIPDQPKD